MTASLPFLVLPELYCEYSISSTCGSEAPAPWMCQCSCSRPPNMHSEPTEVFTIFFSPASPPFLLHFMALLARPILSIAPLSLSITPPPHLLLQPHSKTPTLGNPTGHVHCTHTRATEYFQRMVLFPIHTRLFITPCHGSSDLYILFLLHETHFSSPNSLLILFAKDLLMNITSEKQLLALFYLQTPPFKRSSIRQIILSMPLTQHLSNSIVITGLPIYVLY